MRNVIVRVISFIAACYITVSLLPLFIQGSIQLTTTVSTFVDTMSKLEISTNDGKE
jgi:hypothetical protein